MIKNIKDILQLMLDEENSAGGMDLAQINYVETIKNTDPNDDELASYRVIYESKWTATSQDETVFTHTDVLVFIANKALGL